MYIACLFVCLSLVQEENLVQEEKQERKNLYDELNQISIKNLEGFHVEILLDEIGIVGDQANRLKALIQKLSKEETELHIDLGLIQAGRKPESLRQPTFKKLSTIDKRLKDGIDEILIPHQSKRMEQALVQRTMLKLNGNAEPFEIPLLFSKDLQLSNKELENLKKATSQARVEFEKEKKRLALDAWDSITDELGMDQKAALERIAGDFRRKLAEGAEK